MWASSWKTEPMAPLGIGHKVEGRHAVAAAAKAGRVRRLLAERGRADDELLAAVRSGGGVVESIDDARAVAQTGAPQGLVAECRPIPAVSLFEAVGLSDPAALVVLDRLEDPRNVGAVARSALAAGMAGMVISTRRSAPIEATAFKAAAGALEHLRVAIVSSIADAVRDLAGKGVWTVGLDAGGDRALFGLDLLAEPVALVVGAEGSGLSRLVADRVDVLAGIPISPRVESLNVSVAAALAMFEVARVRRTAE